MTISARTAATCGIVGPVAFVGGWLVNGLRTDGYDPLRDAISQLARVGSPTRLSMSACFVVFGVLGSFGLVGWGLVRLAGLSSRPG